MATLVIIQSGGIVCSDLIDAFVVLLTGLGKFCLYENDHKKDNVFPLNVH